MDLTLTDSVSKGWVWGATVSIQDRSVTEYYQSDRGPVTLRITGLSPGLSVLRVEAPYYEPIALPVTLHRGSNRLSQPLAMRGFEIPDLTSWVVFESAEGRDIVGEMRPVASNGTAIVNHPCLDIWVGAQVSVELINGAPALRDTVNGWSRGEQVFRGPVPWTWDATPETAFRYSVRIPGNRMQGSLGAYFVVDYLIVVPDPRKTTRQEIEQLVAPLWSGPGPLDPKAIARKLDGERDRLPWFLATSLNVRAPTP